METQKDLSTKGQWQGRPLKPFLEVTYTTPIKDKDSLFLPFQERDKETWARRYMKLRHQSEYGILVKDVSRIAQFKANYTLYDKPISSYEFITLDYGFRVSELLEKVPFMTAEYSGEFSEKEMFLFPY
jgi:hypothetical protein